MANNAATANWDDAAAPMAMPRARWHRVEAGSQATGTCQVTTMPQPKRSTPPSVVPFRARLIVWALLLWARALAAQQAWATTLWIWSQAGPLNHIFGASITAATAAPLLWIGCSGQIGAALGGRACVE